MVTGFDRPNLFFRVVTRKGGSQKDNSIINYVKKHEDESGIIYCATKKNVDKLYTLLNEQGISAGRYHAGLSNEERKQNQENFTYDRILSLIHIFCTPLQADGICFNCDGSAVVDIEKYDII